MRVFGLKNNSLPSYHTLAHIPTAPKGSQLCSLWVWFSMEGILGERLYTSTQGLK